MTREFYEFGPLAEEVTPLRLEPWAKLSLLSEDYKRIVNHVHELRAAYIECMGPLSTHVTKDLNDCVDEGHYTWELT